MFEEFDARSQKSCVTPTALRAGSLIFAMLPQRRGRRSLPHAII